MATISVNNVLRVIYCILAIVSKKHLFYFQNQQEKGQEDSSGSGQLITGVALAHTRLSYLTRRRLGSICRL